MQHYPSNVCYQLYKLVADAPHYDANCQFAFQAINRKFSKNIGVTFKVFLLTSKLGLHPKDEGPMTLTITI
eukprot:6478188-Amphidinium_carterae.3